MDYLDLLLDNISVYSYIINNIGYHEIQYC